MSALSADAKNQLFRSGDFADCIVISGDNSIGVHQNIICPQSAVLKESCEEGLKVSNDELFDESALT